MKVRNGRELMRAAAPVFRRHPEVKRACVFGSFARGEQTETSDVDFLLSVEGRQTYQQNFLLRNELSEALGRDVDMVTTLRNAPPYFIEELRKDSVCVYESKGLGPVLLDSAPLRQN